MTHLNVTWWGPQLNVVELVVPIEEKVRPGMSNIICKHDWHRGVNIPSTTLHSYDGTNIGRGNYMESSCSYCGRTVPIPYDDYLIAMSNAIDDLEDNSDFYCAIIGIKPKAFCPIRHPMSITDQWCGECTDYSPVGMLQWILN